MVGSGRTTKKAKRTLTKKLQETSHSAKHFEHSMSIRKGTNEAKEYLWFEKHIELLFAFLMLKEDPQFP